MTPLLGPISFSISRIYHLTNKESKANVKGAIHDSGCGGRRAFHRQTHTAAKRRGTSLEMRQDQSFGANSMGDI